MAGQLDLDDWRQLLHAYQDLCGNVVAQLGGHVAQYLGDGILVYFGYPVSHEDDGLRAVRAGLRLVEAVEDLTRNLQPNLKVDLRVRVGIHTGLVVIGEIGTGMTRDRLALGVVPSLAARIQSITEPNSVVISAATQSLVRGFVDCREERHAQLAGFAGPVALYQVYGETGVESRVAAEAREGMPGFVGREPERQRLLDLWKTAREGGVARVLLSGEPGIGKSRQIHALKEQITGEGKRLIECRCSRDDHNSAFRPILNAIERMILGGKLTTPSEKLERLEELARSAALDVATVLPLLAPLFALPLDPASYPVPDLSPFKARELTLGALNKLLLPPTTQAPILLIVEDLHWADASTRDLLNLALQDASSRPALIIMTVRSGMHVALPALASVPQISLDRLDRADSCALARRVAGSQLLSEATLDFVADKSDGIPLFVEELTKAILELGSEGPSLGDVMPLTLRGLLAARLDRTKEAKAVAQLASALGREFQLDLLQAVSLGDESSLHEQLDRLIQSGLLVAVADPGAGTYAFKHVLIRDAAYDSLLRQTRTDYHGRIAATMVARFPALVEARPELVAEHYRLGEQAEESLNYWQIAGSRALQTSTYREAVSHLSAGMTQLDALDSAERRRSLELDLRSKLGMALIATEGYGSQNVEQNFARAAELSSQLSERVPSSGDRDMQFLANWGLWAYQIVRADFKRADEASRQLEALASQPPDEGLRLEAHVSAGMNLLWSGADPDKAEREFLAALELYDPVRHRHHAVRFSQDPKTISLAYLQWLAAMSGDVQRALDYLEQAQQHMQSHPHPYSEAFHAGHTAQLFYFLCEEQQCAAQARKAVQLSQERGFPTWLATGGLFHGWCVARGGKIAAGIEEVNANLGIWDLIHIALNGPTRLELLSRLQELGGELEGALASVNKAIEAAERTGELFYEPELHRRRAALCARVGKLADAEAAYRKALASARRRHSRLFELRAAVGLARLLGDKRQERSELLGPACASFSEDSQLPDLLEARKLLDR